MVATSDETERHKAKMANRKAAQDAEVAAKTIEKGLLIVHTGKGKGKSTAAFGLLLRALGRGFRVGVVQFVTLARCPESVDRTRAECVAHPSAHVSVPRSARNPALLV